MPRLQIELTSTRPDGSWTWRVAGARQPRGVVAADLLPTGVKVGDVLRVDAEVELEGTTVTAVIGAPPKKREREHLELIGNDQPFEAVTTSLVPKGARPRRSTWDGGGERGPRTGPARPGGQAGRPGAEAGGTRGTRPGTERDPAESADSREPRSDRPRRVGPHGLEARLSDSANDEATHAAGGPSEPGAAEGSPRSGEPGATDGPRGSQPGVAERGSRGPAGPGAAHREPRGVPRRGGAASGPRGARSAEPGTPRGQAPRPPGTRRATAGPGDRPASGPPTRPKRLNPANVHRAAALAELAPEERPVAEQVLQGGIPAVRRALQEQNAKSKAEGQPEIKADAILALAEQLLPRLKTAEWHDRAEAAVADVDELGLRDLRSVVAGADVARDEETRMLAKTLREALERREAKARQDWLDEISRCLDDGRLVRALRVAARPPDPRTRFSAELAARLSEAAGAAMTPDALPDRWLTVLDAVLDSPVRRLVKPVGLPSTADNAVLNAARQASGRVPALAAMLGIDIPPPPGPPRPGNRPARPTGRSGGPPRLSAAEAARRPPRPPTHGGGQRPSPPPDVSAAAPPRPPAGPAVANPAAVSPAPASAAPAPSLPLPAPGPPSHAAGPASLATGAPGSVIAPAAPAAASAPPVNPPAPPVLASPEPELPPPAPVPPPPAAPPAMPPAPPAPPMPPAPLPPPPAAVLPPLPSVAPVTAPSAPVPVRPDPSPMPVAATDDPVAPEPASQEPSPATSGAPASSAAPTEVSTEPGSG